MHESEADLIKMVKKSRGQAHEKYEEQLNYVQAKSGNPRPRLLLIIYPLKLRFYSAHIVEKIFHDGFIGLKNSSMESQRDVAWDFESPTDI